MAGIVVTNLQVGVSSLQETELFSSNACSSSGFSLSFRPISGIAFKLRNRTLRSRLISKASLNGGSILGNEFEFKRSFDEYLKVMESVKTMREKKQVTGLETRKTLLDEAEEDEEDANLVREEGFEKPEKRREKAMEIRGRFDRKVKSDVEKTNGKLVKDERKWQSSGPDETRRIDVKRDDSKRGFEKTHSLYDKVLGHDDFQRKYVRRGEVRTLNESSAARNGKMLNKGDFRSKDEIFNGKNLNLERAAFRNLDESSNDVMDGKRHPRVEMDERIQKLAMSLNGADVDMPEWIFSKMMKSAQILYTDHSFSRLIQILGKLGNWRRVLQVIEWLQIRERFKSHKLGYIYTSALCVLGKARRPVEALNVFDAMQQDMSSYPDIVAYHSIAVTLGQAGHMKELFDVIDVMRSPPKKNFKTGPLGKWDPRLEPDIIVYNAVLNACVQRKQWEGAFWVLQQLKDKSIQPSVTTYGLVMEVMFECGKYNLVHDFFRKVQKSSIPNALTYRVLVNTLWKEGKLDEAEEVVKDMEKRGIVGSAALYYDFARALCSAGRSKDALKQVEKICKVANKPLVVTYTGLIQACLDSGNVKDGAYIFSHMKQFCSPNLVTCNIMLKGYLKNGMFEKGMDLFKTMLEEGSRIKKKHDQKVWMAPDIFTFNTLLESCVAEKRWDDFEFAYKKMLRHGYHFNPKRHLSMIISASRAGKVALVDVTWTHLVDFDRTPPPSLVKERFCLKLGQEDYASVLSCICSQNSGEAHEFSKRAWLKLFGENSLRSQKGTLLRLLDETSNIIARTDEINPSLNNLLAACKELTCEPNVEPMPSSVTFQTVPLC